MSIRLRAGDVRNPRYSSLGPRTGDARPCTLGARGPRPGPERRVLLAGRVDRARKLLHICHSHLAMNLLVKFPGIPEEGSTVSTYDRECDPEATFCRTPMHVWEIHCPECRATGKVPIVRKRKSRIMATCPRCSGLGFVRYVSARDFTEEDSEGFSLMRENQAGEYYNSKKLGRKNSGMK